jgi:hypothetical protein
MDLDEVCTLAEVVGVLCALRGSGAGQGQAPSISAFRDPAGGVLVAPQDLWDEIEEDPDRRPYVWDLE